jgi:hypothetical protein
VPRDRLHGIEHTLRMDAAFANLASNHIAAAGLKFGAGARKGMAIAVHALKTFREGMEGLTPLARRKRYAWLIRGTFLFTLGRSYHRLVRPCH